jgi:SHAQKYF class myb-like DNA-binding protein
VLAKEANTVSAKGDVKADAPKATGRWTREEHFRFLEALKLYGKEWKRVQMHVGTRSSTQARSHAQKFFVKLEKKNLTMDQFLQ